MRGPLSVAGLMYLGHTTRESLAAIRHDKTVDHHRLDQRCRERITYLIMFG